MSKVVRDKEVCFIICSNNQLYTEECIYYIAHLHVPDGYQINVLTIEDAKSMAAGYNEGMYASDAKYKVYLHQDVLIINKDFIQDFLDVFGQDETIGMIGMVGAPRLPASGVMWEGPRKGAFYNWSVHEMEEIWMADDAQTEVEVIDGFLMITQYDIPWREDLFDQWHFYDCSQSKEFARRGYKVVVPKLGKPWCIHDSGFVSLMNYDKERLKFIKEYGQEIPALQDKDARKATVILTTCNRKVQLQDTLEWLSDMEGISNIVIVDNGSTDGTAEWLASRSYEYLWFDEGIQGYGRLWNTVLENFAVEEHIIFMEAGVYPGKESLPELLSALCTDSVGVANPVTNYYGDDGNAITGRDALAMFARDERIRHSGNASCRTLSSNWRIWAARKELFENVGLFREELQSPDNVLTDYVLRMIQNNLGQVICQRACAWESFSQGEEIYAVAWHWQVEDRAFMKAAWGMNYFNLRPNRTLVKYIEEPAEREFKVLEVGCDLGATLFEIKSCYPNCQTYGLDINEAAVDIARHIARVKYGNIDELTVPFEEKFDYIIFGDVLEHLRHPEEVVRMCRELLHENGYIIASIPNVMHISVMEELIEGRFRYSDTGLLDRTHIHFFTYYEIMSLFQEAGYEVKDINGTVFNLSNRQREIMNILLKLSKNTEAWMYETFQYTVKAQKR